MKALSGHNFCDVNNSNAKQCHLGINKQDDPVTTSPQKQYHAASGNTEDLTIRLRVISSKMGRIYSSLATLSRVLLKGGFSDNPGQKSWDTFAKTPQIRASPLHPQCNVDLKGSSHPESLQALSTLLGVGGGRAVTKTV